MKQNRGQWKEDTRLTQWVPTKPDFKYRKKKWAFTADNNNKQSKAFRSDDGLALLMYTPTIVLILE